MRRFLLSLYLAVVAAALTAIFYLNLVEAPSHFFGGFERLFMAPAWSFFAFVVVGFLTYVCSGGWFERLEARRFEQIAARLQDNE